MPRTRRTSTVRLLGSATTPIDVRSRGTRSVIAAMRRHGVRRLVVRASGLDWVIAQPVNLTDAAEDADPFASTDGEVHGIKVSRTRVGRFLVDALRSAAYVGKSVALSA